MSASEPVCKQMNACSRQAGMCKTDKLRGCAVNGLAIISSVLPLHLGACTCAPALFLTTSWKLGLPTARKNSNFRFFWGKFDRTVGDQEVSAICIVRV